MTKPATPNYLAGYPAHLTESVQRLIERDQLGKVLRQKYPEVHQVRTDKALYDYVQEIKATYLRNAPQPRIGNSTTFPEVSLHLPRFVNRNFPPDFPPSSSDLS